MAEIWGTCSWFRTVLAGYVHVVLYECMPTLLILPLPTLPHSLVLCTLHSNKTIIKYCKSRMSKKGQKGQKETVTKARGKE